MINKQLIHISRPRFWIYTLGPFLIGIAASGILWKIHYSRQTLGIGALVLLGLLFFELLSYFTYGGNLLVYGVNDLADRDTDKYNDKKMGYEQALDTNESTRKTLIHRIIVTQALFFIMITVLAFFLYGQGIYVDYPALILFWVLFMLTSIFYSMKPIRAKAKPFLDGLFNALYALPALVGFVAFGGEVAAINWIAFLAGWFRCIAMHTFSAIPDIEPDQKAGLTTTAVFFGEKDTLMYCGGIWLRSAFLASYAMPELKLFFMPAVCIYIALIAACLHFPVMKIYKLFPWINGIIGFILFWAISLQGVLW